MGTLTRLHLVFATCICALAPATAFAQHASEAELEHARNLQHAMDVAEQTVHVATKFPLPRTHSLGKGDAHELGVTISGGVSLGVYQAGFMYALNEVAKRSEQMRFHTFTGASAGSANSLMSAISSCLPQNDFPHDDLGWKVWVDVGYQDLFVEEKVTDVSIFTRDPMIRKTDFIRQAVVNGINEGCDVVVGVSVTREETRMLELAQGLSVPTQSEKFLVRFQGRGPGKPALITNYVDHFSHLPQPLLPFTAQIGKNDTKEVALANFNHIADVVLASAAFPVAFKPQHIHYCFTAPRENDPEWHPTLHCTKPEHRDPFIDGGVYDNNPLRLATSVAKRGLRVDSDGEVYWRDPVIAPERDDQPIFAGLKHLYVDPDTRAYPTPRDEEPPDVNQLVPLATQLASEFVETSRSRELYALMQEAPDLKGQMRLSTVHFPTASEHLGAFMGLFERDFRVFDFYLGMYDGWKSAEAYVPTIDAHEIVSIAGRHPDELEKVATQLHPFTCMMSYVEEGFEDWRNTCKGDEMRNFRILLQVALDRLYSTCQKLDSTELDGFDHPHCLAASLRKSPPRVVGVRALDDELQWMRRDDESEFDHAMRLYEHYQFAFHDLGLTPEEANLGRVRIRRKFLKMIKYIADAQDSYGDRTVLLTAGRSMVNQLWYEPPRNFWYIAFGGVAEIGASVLPFDWDDSWARLHMALQAKSLFSPLTEDLAELQLTPMIGPEFHLLFMTSQTFQPIVGVRGGYQFSTRDDFNFQSCTEALSDDDDRKCSQAIIQPYFVLSLLERVRFQAAFEFYPQDFDFDDKSFDLLLSLGVHFF